MADEDTKQTGGLRETRQFARYPVSLPVIGRAVKTPKKEIRGVVRSLGAGGLMAEFPVRMLPGSAVGLILQTRHGPLTLEGRVVWTSATGGTIRHGFAFLEPKWPGFAMDLFLDENR
jgi:hypothetical protein